MKFSKLQYTVMSGLVLLLGCFALAAPKAVGYHLLKKVPLGGGGGGREYFDYINVDAPTRRIYLSHGTEVIVLDADSNAEIGRISDMKGNHGIALVKDVGRGFISDGGNNRVVVFDLKTLKSVGEIKTGDNPDCIIYDPASKHVFTFNGGTKDSTVIDPKTQTVVATVPMGGRPEYAVADGKGMIYDNIQDKNEVVALDTRALTIKAHWPIAPATTAAAMGMDLKHRRLFIGGRNKTLAIMNADNGKVIQTFPVGDGVDTNVFEPSTQLIFSSTREGTIQIFHEDSPDSFSEVETIKTEYGAKTMGLDPKTHNLFTDTMEFGPPPPPTAEQPNPAPVPVSGTFHLLIYAR